MGMTAHTLQQPPTSSPTLKSESDTKLTVSQAKSLSQRWNLPGLAALLSDEGQRADHPMPVWIQAGKGRSGAQTVEGGIESHGSHASHRADKRNKQTAQDKVSAHAKAAKDRWANMSNAAKKRMLKKMYEARYPKGKKRLTAEERAAKQRVYQARHEARVKGEELPALPKAS